MKRSLALFFTLLFSLASLHAQTKVAWSVRAGFPAPWLTYGRTCFRRQRAPAWIGTGPMARFAARSWLWSSSAPAGMTALGRFHF